MSRHFISKTEVLDPEVKTDRLGKSNFKESSMRFIKSTEFGTLAALIALIVFTGAFNQSFFSLYNLQTLGQQWAVFGMLAIGEIFVIVIGGGAIDLSLGSITSLSGVLVALFMVDYHMSPLLAIILTLTIDAGWGSWHGLAFTKLNVPPFITTLGTLAIARGLSSVITHGWPIINIPPSFIFLGQGSFLEIPFPVIMLLVIAAIAAFFFYHTIYGVYFKAIGGNVEAAKMVGINIVKMRTIPFVISDVLAGLVGIIIAARLSQGQPSVGESYELYAIASAVIGGTALTGGIGSIWGGLIGAGIITTIWNAMVLLGISAYWQNVALGIVIVGAVTFDVLRRAQTKKQKTLSTKKEKEKEKE